jgi:hypothetical protein
MEEIAYVTEVGVRNCILAGTRHLRTGREGAAADGGRQFSTRGTGERSAAQAAHDNRRCPKP